MKVTRIDVEGCEGRYAAELVDAASACPRCGERYQDNLVWQKDGRVKCTNCGTRCEPAAG